ncbi:MAG: S-methyl-5'-thioadenosine phosphorylase [Actinomycetes bacterium]
MSNPVGIIGGSGLYELLDAPTAVTRSTPYGAHAEGLTTGVFGGRDVAFLPRHGLGHALPPHRVNYRANLWALASLGVSQVIAPCAAGSLQADLGPGTFVVPDQVVDRTSGRAGTYVERGTAHVRFADPYCPVVRSTLVDAISTDGGLVATLGTMVVIDGPRFSSRAESEWYQRQGWHLVNMTGQPEAALARELALCYSPLAVVTDMDAGASGSAAVTQFDALATFARSLERLHHVLDKAVAALPEHRTCECGHTLDGMDVDYLP